MHDVQDDETPLANRRPRRITRLPARYVVDCCTSDEGGNDILSGILRDDNKVELECDEMDFPKVVDKFIAAEIAFVGAALTEPIDDPGAQDPKTVHKAQSSTYWTHWLAAIYEELESLKAKGVYEDISHLPPGQKAVDCKWVLHIKRNRDGLISRFKKRLVAKGFTQIPGQDFTYTFAPVARWESMRAVLTLAADENMVLRQIDVKTAFLNGPLDEEIYMRQPGIVGSGYWKLLKGLYGLKQAGRQWYLELNSKLELLGFQRLESDWSVYTRTSGLGRSVITTSVDDMLIGSSSTLESDAVVEQLGSTFEITDNGEPAYHLGCGITRNRVNGTLRLDQRSFTQSILREFGMDRCNAVSTPMDPGLHLTCPIRPFPPDETRKVESFPYCAVVGKCMYLSTCTRPDIAYTVRELARFMSNYGPTHVAAAKHLLRYLKGSLDYGITLGGNDANYPAIRALSDSDWGMGDDRKSISGFVVLVGSSPISWSSKQQGVVALSSCEAEYLSVTHCTREVLWFRNLYGELGYPQIQRWVKLLRLDGGQGGVLNDDRSVSFQV